MTRKWAYRAIRQGWPEFSQWLDAVIQRVEMYNASLPVPLSPPECRAIGKKHCEIHAQELHAGNFRTVCG